MRRRGGKTSLTYMVRRPRQGTGFGGSDEGCRKGGGRVERVRTVNLLPARRVRVDNNDQDARLLLLQAGLHHSCFACLACLLCAALLEKEGGGRGGGGLISKDDHD
jgi:hypothetical protein